jgi:N-alpha-acetyltransferase 50
MSKPLNHSQSSIRSFFQPRLPTYAAPPLATNLKINNATTPPLTASVSVSHFTEIPSPEPQSISPLPKPSLPPQARISAIQEEHIQPLKRINSLLLPINYPDSFYHKVLNPILLPSFSRVILWQDEPSQSTPKVVGGIVCRLERDETSKTSAIYLQSLALLSPYRAYGLAAATLNDIIKSAMNTTLDEYPVTTLYAHVWTENTDALVWYLARGFTKEEPAVQGYYRRLTPGNAWILRRSLTPSDDLRHAQSAVAKPPFKSTISASTTVTSSISITPSETPPTNAPKPPVRAASYQTAGPGHEWNDLPEDILSKPSLSESGSSLRPADNFLKPDSNTGSAASSRSRSSTRAGGKKKRQYPAAAFGAAGPGT